MNLKATNATKLIQDVYIHDTPGKKEWVLVTGASSGFGEEFARQYAEKGHPLVLVARRLDRLQTLAETLRQQHGIEVVAEQVDLSDVAAVIQLHQRLRERDIAIDILINNAGIGDFVSFPEISSDKWDRMLNIHLKGSFNCCQAVLAGMKEKKYGKIVNVSSVAGKRGDFIGNAHYTAAKAGIIGLTRSLALYAAPFGINVNAIAPGLVATELSDEMSSEMKATTISRIPAGRLGRPEEIARAAAFLVSEDASYIFGETLSVNGGSYMD